jgi:uncharacterized protein YggE
MRKSTLVLLTLLWVLPAICRAQTGGNIGFSQGGVKARAVERERSRRILSDHEKPPSGTTTFVEADVLMNVKANEFVAVFGISQEAETVVECSRKMEAVVKEFTDDLKALGVVDSDLYLDFVTQTKVYGFEITGEIAKEKHVGFELKKNLCIHYKERDFLDRLTIAASRSKIFDLVKVDYIVSDLDAVQNRLFEEAAKVIKKKSGRYEKLLGVKLMPPAQVFAEKYGTHYPTQMYDSYTAAETEQIAVPFDRNRHLIQSLRKGRTFYFNGLDSDGFDEVINPVIIEPVVQFTLHLKMKYEVEQIKAK